MSTTDPVMSDAPDPSRPPHSPHAPAPSDAAPADPESVPPRDVGGEGPAAPPPPGPYAAKRGQYFINVRYVIVLAFFVMAAWFLYDGIVKWPAENAQLDKLEAEKDQASAQYLNDEVARLDKQIEDEGLTRHSDNSIFWQYVLGFGLPPLGLALLAYWLYSSRGVVRLDEQDVLHVPGHPPVPAAAIKEIDDELWDRKGISHLYYDADGQSGRIKLDDFVYERGPIEKIHKRLVHLRVGDTHPELDGL